MVTYLSTECTEQDFRRQDPGHAIQNLEAPWSPHPVGKLRIVEPPHDAEIEPSATTSAILEDHFGIALSKPVKHGVKVFDMPPEGVFNKAVFDAISTFLHRCVVVKTEHVEVVLFDESRYLRLHPRSDFGIRNIKLTPVRYGLAIPSQHPIGMLFAEGGSGADALGFHPQAEQ